MRVWSLAVVGLFAGANAWAVVPTPQQIDEMTDAVVSLMPMGVVMEAAAAANPEWPVQGKVDAVSKDQLACLRSELSVPGYRRFKRVEVADYLADNNRNIPGEVKVLRQAAPLMSRLIMAGVDAATTKQEVEPADVMRDADADQMLAMLTLGRDPKYRNLRELTGVGEALSGEGSSSDNRATGQMIAAKAMFHGLKVCGASPGALL